MKFWKRAAILALSAALIMSACGKPGGASSSQGQPEEQAKGRYIEEEFALPTDVKYLYDIRMDDGGTLEIFAFLGWDNRYGFFASEDNGETWTKSDPAWLAPLLEKEVSVDAAFFDKDGGLYVSASGEEGDPSGYHAGADGTLTPIAAFPTDKGEGPDMNGLYETGDGNFLCSTYFSISQTDSSFQVNHVFDVEGTVTQGSYTVIGDTLAVCEEGAIRLYNLEDGSLETEVAGTDLTPQDYRVTTNFSISTATRIISADPQKAAFYYCDATGIYHRLMDGSVSERLVDGELSSLTMPTVTLMRLMPASNGDLLVLAHNGDRFILLRYRYDAETPTVPNTELTLYSLRDNKTVRQAIGMFQRQNPDVKVTYEVGVTDETASVSDALRAFNTRLLAGEGPDVLVLDGMPIDSYAEKGVLADLSGSQAETVAGLLPNVAGAFRKGDGLYALPARFSVLMAAMDSDAAKTVTDLDSLTAWLEKQKNPALYCTVPSALIRLLYPIMAPEWFRADGALDKEAFAHSLETLQKLAAVEGKRNERYQIDAAEGVYSDFADLEFGSISFSGEMMSLAIGPLDKLKAAAAAEESIKERGGGAFLPLAGNKGASFTPSAILGVNASAKQPELAQKFVSFALSSQVLRAELEDGLPSNREALSVNLENPYSQEEIDMEQGTYYAISFIVTDEDGGPEVTETCELRVLWPAKAYMDELAAALESVTQAVPLNETVLQMVLEETEGFFDGDQTLEETADAFAQKYGLYQAE